MEQLVVSAHAAAVLVSRLLKSTLTPVAEVAARNEPKVRRLLLASVKTARAAVPMGELVEVLKLGHSGTGAPLYALQDALKVWQKELLGDGVEPAPVDWFRMRAAAAKFDLPTALHETLVSGAAASEVCVPDIGGRGKAHAALDKIKGTTLVGKPKTTISAQKVFGNAVQTAPETTITNYTIETVDVKKLIPTQSVLQRAGVAASIDKEFDVTPSALPLIYEQDGKLFIKDGHHRLAGELLKGVKTILVKVVHVG